jgi:L-threonylcarbamoyladenylate synthase
LSRILAIDPQQPDPRVITEAAETIINGGMVVIPTRHLYGLAVDALNAVAVQKVFAVKGRPADKPLLILVESRAAVARYATAIPEAAHRLMDRFWPGRLTLVFDAADGLPAALTGGSGKIGIRWPAHQVCSSLLERLPHPLTATSANRSGQPGCHRIADLPDGLLTAVDLVLDAGPLPPGAGSSVVDITASPPLVLRSGALDAAHIADALV